MTARCSAKNRLTRFFTSASAVNVRISSFKLEFFHAETKWTSKILVTVRIIYAISRRIFRW